MPRLSIPLETLTYILEKARAFAAEVPQSLPGDSSNTADEEDGDPSALEDTPDNPIEEELTEALEALNDDQKAELVALTWLGRGDFTADDWDEAVEAAHDRDDKDATRYLLGTALLPDLMEEGAAQLGYAREDLEATEP